MLKTLFDLAVSALLLFLVSMSFLRANDTVIRNGTRAYYSLAGEWDVLPINGLKFNYPPPETEWKKEKVPSENGRTQFLEGSPYIYVGKLNPLKEGRFERETGMAAWYRHKFEMPDTLPEDSRAMLYFGGLAYRSEVWLNGQKLGVSYQCCLPIKYDVTEMLAAGGNELLVGLTGLERLTDIENKTLLAPAFGVYPGIRDRVELRFIPRTHIDDIFVKTSVKNKKLEAVVTAKNAGSETSEFTPVLNVYDPDGVPVLRMEGDRDRIPAGQSKQIFLSEDWIADRLWNINDPAIYTAEVQLLEDSTLIDERKQEFGFKEFEIRGRHFYLNGVKTVLFRSSCLSSLGTEPQLHNLYPDVRDKTNNPYNCIRLHLGFNNKHILDGADRSGMMTIPESGWNQTQFYPHEKKELWLRNTLEYFRGWIKQNRNRPSVIMWSLCNETYWDRRNPAELAIAAEILELAREMDPTRPQQGDGECSWNGMLPTINIHYPEGTAGTVRHEYINSGIVVPNDLHWLKKDGLNKSWRAEFVWDRPLMLGEYWWHSGDISANSSFMGDSAFDWEKWRFQKISDPSFSPDNKYIETLQKATDWYRKMGVACLNPWSGDRKLFMKAVDVRPLEFYRNFYGGKTGTRKVIVFNDSFDNYYSMHLQCDLKVDSIVVWKDEVKVHAPKGEHREFDVPIDFPAVTKPVKASLTVRLRYWSAGGWRELSRYDENVFIMPETDWSGVSTEDVVLYDPSGKTADALQKAGFQITAQNFLNTAILEEAELLIAGDDSRPQKFGPVLEEFVQKGGKIIILRQNNWRAFISELPENDPKHAASQCWLRNFDHPIFQNVFEEQFSFWRPEHLVCRENYWKPSGGNFRILLDCGGRYGMRWTPLVEVPYGDGLFILSQLNIVSSINEEPMAAYFLKNMIEYCRGAPSPKLEPLRVLAGSNKDIKQLLQAQSVVFTESLDGGGPVLVDSSAELSSEDLTVLEEYLDMGGTLWLHGFTPETVSKIANLIPFQPQLVTPDETVKAAARRSQDPLINSLASFDFMWTTVDAGGRADFFQRSKPTAELGDYVLKQPPLHLGTPLLVPSFFVKIPRGKGQIFFDTLKWEQAVSYEADKVGRILSALLTNCGAEIKLKPEKSYDYFFVDLSPYANMGYYDQTAGDGKGGWTDQGRNDMRFFMINHTGRAGGSEDGMPVSTDPFPAKVRLAKKPFQLTVPSENDGKAVITLRGGEHCDFLPSEVTNMKVGEKADMLWFLHTGCWIQVTAQNMRKIAEYMIHYTDGTVSVFPIRAGIEIGDWWSPSPLPRSKVAWTGMNLMHSPVGMWMTSWENPHPEKTIESIDLKGNIEPSQYVLLAVTGGQQIGENGAETISEWDFSFFKNGTVENEVPGMPPLKSGKKMPVPAADNGAGLLFENGASLTGASSNITEACATQPFKLSVRFTPLEKPDGYYGGIFECIVYEEAGFRLMLQQSSLRLNVEIFCAGGEIRHLSGKTPLKMGHEYQAEVIFKNHKAYLYLNGQLDACVDSPLPAKCTNPLNVGRASGKDYNFNGVIEKVSIVELKE